MTPTGSLAAPAVHTRHSRRPGKNRDAAPPSPKLVLLLASGAIFVAALDAMVVNAAFPDLRADFPSASLPTLSWVVTAYAVLSAALVAPAGRIADVVGRRRLFAWSIVAFTVASALAAAAPDEGFLIFFRVLQGAAAAGMGPASLGLVLTWTSPERRMAAIGVWAASASVAAAVGPALGGVLVHAWSWRAIFLINLPLGLAILYGTMTRLAPDTPSGRRLPDPVGTVLFAVGTGAVVVGLSQGTEWGWTSTSVEVALAGGVLGVGAGLVRSVRHPAPALELDLWRDRTFTGANIATLFFGASVFGIIFTGPLFLTATWDYSVLQAGLAATPGALASSVGAVVVGKRATTPGGRRAAAVAGCLLVAAGGFHLWAQLGTEDRFFEVYLPATMVAGVGLGATLPAVFGAAATSVPPTRFASGSGLLTMSRQLGMALGIAAIAAILAAPGYADAVDPFLTAYLFCGATAVVAAVLSAGLLRARAAADTTANDVAARSGPAGAGRRGSGRRGRVAVALVGVAALAGLGVFIVTANSDGAPPPGSQAAVDEAPQAWSGPMPAGRSLVLIDVSASMGEQTGAGVSWLQATTQAVAAGVGPVSESTEVGVWLAGSRVQGERDWAELFPVGPLGEQLGLATRGQLIQSSLGQVGAVPDDRLGLYDSVLAAFRAVNNINWSYRGNAVVVFTDGRNDDPGGATLENLLAVLGDEFDPSYPVHINIISLGGATDKGDGVDRDALTRIAEATRGGVYAASSPQQAEELFRAAMPSRT